MRSLGGVWYSILCLRVARALDGLPEINEAFEKGELSFSKVRAMTRIATALNESYLLMIANHGTAQHVAYSSDIASGRRWFVG